MSVPDVQVTATVTALDRLLARPRRTASVTVNMDPNDPAATSTATWELVGIGPDRQKALITQWVPDEGEDPPEGPSFAAHLLAATCRRIVLSEMPTEPLTDLEPETVERIFTRLTQQDIEVLEVTAMRLDISGTAKVVQDV